MVVSEWIFPPAVILFQLEGSNGFLSILGGNKDIQSKSTFFSFVTI